MSAFWKNHLKACAQRGLPFLKSYDGTFFYKWTHITRACSNTSSSLYPELHFCVKHCSVFSSVFTSCASLNESEGGVTELGPSLTVPVFNIQDPLSTELLSNNFCGCKLLHTLGVHCTWQWTVKCEKALPLCVRLVFFF